MRIDKGMQATEVIRQLQLKGWDVANSSYSQLETGDRILADVELLLILEVLGAKISDLTHS